MRSFLSPWIKTPERSFELVNRRNGRVCVASLEVAADSASRNRGLLGRDGLAPGAGLIIAPTKAVHTFFMRFSIDLVWLDREGLVLKVRGAVPAGRISGALRAFAVLELPANAARDADLCRSDRVELRLHESSD